MAYRMMCIIKQDFNLAKEISHKYAGQGFDIVVCPSIKILKEIVKQVQDRKLTMDFAIVDNTLVTSDNLDIIKFLKYHFPKIRLAIHKEGALIDPDQPITPSPKVEKPEVYLGNVREWKQEVKELNNKFQIEKLRKDIKKAQEEFRRGEIRARNLKDNDPLHTKVLPALQELEGVTHKPFRKLIWKQVLFLVEKYKINISVSELRTYLRHWKRTS